MSSPPLTVPPPRDEDHEDVAWALRAAHAQWRREDHADAIGWVRRAAETAAEVGDAPRARELQQLADYLISGGRAPAFPSAPAPVPPPAPSAPPAPSPPPVSNPAAIAPPPRSSYPDVEFDVDVDVDLDGDEIELIDGDEDLIIEDDVEELEPEEIEPEPVVPAAPSYAPPRPSGSSAPPRAPLPPSARPTAKQSPSQLPTFNYPEDSAPEQAKPAPPPQSAPPYPPRNTGLELDSYEEEEPAEEEEPEFGELDFQDEAPTSPASVPEAPSVPALSVKPGGGRLSLDPSTPAEYAQSMPGGGPAEAEDIEEELGVDLSLDVAAPRPARPSAFSPDQKERSRERTDRSRSDHSPTPGRASVRPSRPPGGERPSQTGRQPYEPAPSASAPPVRPIEPPSRPSSAPPSASMEEPEPHESSSPASPEAQRRGEAPLPSSIGRSSPMRGYEEDEDQEAPGYPEGLAAPEEDEEIHAALDSLQAPPPEGGTTGSREPAVPGAPSVAQAPSTEVEGIDLADVQGLQDLPEDAQAELVSKATFTSLGEGQEISSFGVALVTQGAVKMMPMVADATCASARKGEVLFTRGSMPSATTLRIVAAEPDSRVAIFSDSDLEAATADCPWVADELAEVADRYNAFAGAVMGPLGYSLDEMFRSMVFDKCSIRNKAPAAVIAEAGKPTDGMYIVGVGKVEIMGDDGTVVERLHPGDFVFPETVLNASPASQTVRAGKEGVILLYAERMAAHELLATCPPFLEILAS